MRGPTSIFEHPLTLVNSAEKSPKPNYFVSTRHDTDDEVKLLMCTLALVLSVCLSPSLYNSVAHINAYTSKVALLRKLPDDWKQNISCGFKLSKSLNILHHLLKKLTGLEEGQYLIVHKSGEPFVTILKATNGKMSQGAYNLQQVHSSVPQPPASSFVPWIPVDPAVILPFHQQHGRVPCTFPPTPFLKMAKYRSHNQAGQSNINLLGGGNKKKGKKKKRTTKRNAYIKNLIEKSI